jgi:hypothetical protein
MSCEDRRVLFLPEGCCAPRVTAWLDSRRLVVILTAVAYALFIVARLRWHGFDVSYFVTAGDYYVDPRLVPGNLSVISNSGGYDGQFYYRLALDPFTGHAQAFGITLDEPPIRQSRIGYPLLVWALSLGRVPPVAAFMLIVNAVALCVIGWLGAVYARSQGRYALWGLAFPLSAGLLLSLSRDLTESLATCLLFAGMLLVHRKRQWLGAFVLCLAVLTRETTLLYSASALAAGLWRHWQSRHGQEPLGPRHYLIFAAPLAVYGIWEILMSVHWDRFAYTGRSVDFDWPGIALTVFVRYILPPVKHEQMLWLIELTFLAGFTLSALWILQKLEGRLPYERAAWLGYGAFALMWSDQLWSEDWAFMRALSEFSLLGTMLLLAAPSRLRLPVLAGSLALWLIVARDALYR